MNEESKKYIYIFTRQDMIPEQQIVQSAHATLLLGKYLDKEEDPNNIYFTLIGVRNLEALNAVEEILFKFAFKYEAFVEPDIGFQKTSIAVYPIDEAARGPLMAFNLLKISS
jgi:hypothetical protein